MDARKPQMANQMKKVISIIGDHYAVGPRDLCGLPNRLFMELAVRDPDTYWSVMGHGALGGIKSVVEAVPEAFVEMFSCEADSYTAIIWVGIGEAKSGGIPLDAWGGMLDHLICQARAADVTPLLILPVVPPTGMADKYLRRWLKKAIVVASDVAEKRQVRQIKLQLEQDNFVDLHALTARCYQHIAKVLADEYLGKVKTRKPRLVKTPEIIYKRNRSDSKRREPPAPTKDVVVIMQPDRTRNKRSAHG